MGLGVFQLRNRKSKFTKFVQKFKKKKLNNRNGMIQTFKHIINIIKLDDCGEWELF